MAMAVVRREMRPRAEEGRPGDAPTSSLRVTDARPGLGRFMRPRTGDPGRCGNQMSTNRDPREGQNPSAPGVGPYGPRRQTASARSLAAPAGARDASATHAS
jgi:hypothetical protein